MPGSRLVELAEAANARQALAALPARATGSRRIPDGAYACGSTAAATQRSSEDLAAFIEERRMARADLCFVVGGPLGLDQARAGARGQRLALGR